MIGTIVSFVIWLYLVILTVRALLSWLPLFIRDWRPRGVLLIVAEFVYTLTDPPLRWLGRVLPPIRIGGAQWDIAFLVLFLVLSVALRVVPAVL